jgi:hypothetical protein
MNDIQKFESNLFAKYADYANGDHLETDSKILSDGQKQIVEKALNSTFINPKFKMRHFVTSGQITPYSTVRQWLLELRNAEEQLENLEHGLKKAELERELIELRIEKEQDPIVKIELQLELEKNKHNYKQNKRRVQQHYIEREQYAELMEEYLAGPNGKTPDGRSWLEIMGTPEEDIYEKEYWTVRLAKQAAMDISAYGRISAGNLDAITQMAAEQQSETLALAHEFNMRVDNLSNLLKSNVYQALLKNDPNFKIGDSGQHTASENNKPQGLLDVYRT